jgi:hypothetical protein
VCCRHRSRSPSPSEEFPSGLTRYMTEFWIVGIFQKRSFNCLFSTLQLAGHRSLNLLCYAAVCNLKCGRQLTAGV